MASCILIVENGNFLAVSLKHDKTDFNLPGGKVERNETFTQAAVRELKEETGLSVNESDLILLHENYDIGYNQKFYVKTYLSEKYTGEIYTDESGIVKWLPLEELKNSKSWVKYNTEVYNKYLAYIKK